MSIRHLALASAAILALTAAKPATSALTMGPPLGVTWGPVYGFPHYPAAVFVPQARGIGASFTRVTLYWSQLEPEAGVRRWDDLDAYLAQLTNSDEALLTIASASPWATRTAAWVFPSSPAKDAQTYYDFVRAVVARSKGRIRYFQSDPEPNNPFFWSGSADDYAAQARVFYRAVKDADPNAIVVLGGCDGLFDPTGKEPLPGQAADLAFFSRVIAQAAGAYDVFDLRLYGDAYTIPDRVDLIRGAMAKSGDVKPIISTEYDGPGFFEFPANRRWFSSLSGANASPAAVRQLIASSASLPIETRMYLPDASVPDAARLLALQSDDLIVRNVLALASGIQKTAFFDLWHDDGQADAPDTVLYGAFRLLARKNGAFDGRLPLGDAFARLADLLHGATLVERVGEPPHPDVFVYRITRGRLPPAWIAWRRPVALGANADPIAIDAPWSNALHPPQIIVGSAPETFVPGSDQRAVVR